MADGRARGVDAIQRVAAHVSQICGVRLRDGASVTLETDAIVVGRIPSSARRLGALQVSGVFRATAPRALAESLAAAFDLQVKADPDRDIVLDRQGPPLAEPAA